MYVRRTTKKKGGTDYACWLLVESIRTIRGPRQRVVATIGKLPSLDREERIGWEEIGRLLAGKPHPEPGLFAQPEAPPSWATVNIKGVRVERLRHFGDVYLGLLLWKKLGLADFCREHIPSGRAEIPWSVMATLLTLARFCAPSSELQIAESWYDKTALDDLLGVPGEKIHDDRLYRALDALLPHKDALCRHLQKRYGELFGATFEFLFYDITSTYFEGAAKGNRQAQRGYSRDSRPDCPQVCIGLVASKEGLPLAFEIFDGHRVNVTTTKEMVAVMESKYGTANRVWVMDRGMVSEDNLEFMRATGARYLVGTPKSMLKKFAHHLVDQNWEEVQPGVDVKLCRSPEGTEETFVLCRAAGRKEKENAILNRFVIREQTIKADVPLRAPFDGRIIVRNLTRGEVVETDQKLFTVANLTDVWVIGNVPEKDVQFIHNDQKVDVVLAAYPHAIFTGTITYIGDVLDPATRTMHLRVTVPNPDRLLKPEMFAIVRVYAASSPDALSVPLAALQDGPAGKMVFVQGGAGTFEGRAVKLGNEEGDVVRVLEGVKAGEQVVTKGSFALKSEMDRNKIEPAP